MGRGCLWGTDKVSNLRGAAGEDESYVAARSLGELVLGDAGSDGQVAAAEVEFIGGFEFFAGLGFDEGGLGGRSIFDWEGGGQAGEQ